MPNPSYDGGGGSEQVMEQRLTKLLGPYEQLIMTVQSLLVWECPWKSTVLFSLIHVILWFICTTSSRFFFLLSVLIMAAIFIDTWKNKIWPEIRVPPKEPEDQDGWTPVHPRLLSVPELSRHLSHMIATTGRTLKWLRSARVSHPLVFCLGNTAFFTITAMIGYYVSGFMLAYIVLLSLMLWPCVLYHSLVRKAFVKLEPHLTVVNDKVKSRCLHVITFGGRLSVPSLPSWGSSSSRPMEDEDFLPQTNPEAIAALAKAITDSEDEGDVPRIDTPRMSKHPSFSNILDDNSQEHEQDFQLDLTQMPSFDDLDNTDDDLDLPSMSEPSQSSRLNAIHFSARHFADSDEEAALGLDFSNNEWTGPSSSTGGDLSPNSLTGSLVARTISSMMESALQGMATIGQGQTASSSSMIPRTGAKLTYTCTEEGESIDFQNPEPTILESEEEETTEDSFSRSEQIAEIEKDFDFLDELDPDNAVDRDDD